VNHLL
jgi:hypothetical protein